MTSKCTPLTSSDLMNFGENKVNELHQWIEKICDSEYNVCREFTKYYFDNCAKNCIKVEPLSLKEMSQITGVDFNAVEINFNGVIRRRNTNGQLFEGKYKNGLPHGYFRQINEYGDLDFFGCFINGVLHGQCWRSLAGGGFIFANSVDFSGSNVTFLYPDCRTAIIGEFKSGILVKGKCTQIVGSANFCNKKCALLKPEFNDPSGMEYTFDESNEKCISKSPMVPDPYESFFVQVRPSLIPKAGEGLFAQTDIEMGTVLAFYNGVRIKYHPDSFSDKDYPYKLTLNEEYDLNVPDEYTTTNKYCATLGHKICHSFTPNTEFDYFEHPRFGFIRCVVALRDIEEGEELTSNYGYNLSVAPFWYKKLWAKHQKQIRGMPDWQMALAFRSLKLGVSTFSSETSSITSEISSGGGSTTILSVIEE